MWSVGRLQKWKNHKKVKNSDIFIFASQGDGKFVFDFKGSVLVDLEILRLVKIVKMKEVAKS